MYVCGPSGFMDWVLKTAKDGKWPDAQVHREYFAATPATGNENEFEVQIASTGKTFVIPAGSSITEFLTKTAWRFPLPANRACAAPV
jgi:vanillate O-demethylase ferredoxin subunit